MYKKVSWGLTVCLMVLCIIFASGWLKSVRERKNTQSANAEVLVELTATKAILDSLQAAIPPGAGAENNADFWYTQAGRARENQGMLLNESDIRHLQKLGLDDPAQQLRDDLMSHAELIPYEGVLGGTMGFFRSSISLLSRKWVYAEFEDGHIGGNCLLEYQIAPGGKITWTVIRTEVN